MGRLAPARGREPVNRFPRIWRLGSGSAIRTRSCANDGSVHFVHAPKRTTIAEMGICRHRLCVALVFVRAEYDRLRRSARMAADLFSYCPGHAHVLWRIMISPPQIKNVSVPRVHALSPFYAREA